MTLDYSTRWVEERKARNRSAARRYMASHAEEIRTRQREHKRAVRSTPEGALASREAVRKCKERQSPEERAYWAAYSKQWREQHREQFAKRCKEWRARKKACPVYKLVQCLRHRLRVVLRRGGALKSAHTLELLGIDRPGLKAHIESKFLSGMTWENRALWHLDHIRPCASFDLTDPEQQKQCFHYSNLQPLWAKDNLSKGDKWDAQKESRIQ